MTFDTHVQHVPRDFLAEPDWSEAPRQRLSSLKAGEHPWSQSRHLTTDSYLQDACWNIRNGAHDKRLPVHIRKTLWEAHQLAMQARQMLRTAGEAMDKHHDEERRRAIGR